LLAPNHEQPNPRHLFHWSSSFENQVPSDLKGVVFDEEQFHLWAINKPVQMPDSELFVIGDNANTSQDSRSFRDCAVPVSSVKGVLTHRYWPTERWRTFN
tara:strand:- start:3 stop:302 length:300 start_codon:yes stop_codon:yes gene_type:complete